MRALAGMCWCFVLCFGCGSGDGESTEGPNGPDYRGGYGDPERENPKPTWGGSAATTGGASGCGSSNGKDACALGGAMASTGGVIGAGARDQGGYPVRGGASSYGGAYGYGGAQWATGGLSGLGGRAPGEGGRPTNGGSYASGGAQTGGLNGGGGYIPGRGGAPSFGGSSGGAGPEFGECEDFSLAEGSDTDGITTYLLAEGYCSQRGEQLTQLEFLQVGAFFTCCPRHPPQ